MGGCNFRLIKRASLQISPSRAPRRWERFAGEDRRLYSKAIKTLDDAFLSYKDEDKIELYKIRTESGLYNGG